MIETANGLSKQEPRSTKRQSEEDGKGRKGGKGGHGEQSIAGKLGQWLGVTNRQQGLLLLAFALLLVLVVVGTTSKYSPLLSVAGVIALAIGVAALVRPALALFFLFVGAGLPTLTVQLGSHAMRPIEPVLALCVLIIFLHRPRMQLQLPHALALLFFAISLVSYLHVRNSPDSTYYAPSKELFNLVLLLGALFIGTFLVSTIKNLTAFFVFILLGSLPLYLIALAQTLNVHVPSLLEASGAQDPVITLGRLWGPYDGAATFGAYLINLLIVALMCWLLGTRRWIKLVGAVMTIITAVTMVGSGTRSAVIAAIVVVILALIVTHHLRWLFGMVVASTIFVATFIGKILPKFTHGGTSISNRLFLWQMALKLIETHPWIGIGLQQFYVYYNKVTVSTASRLNPTGISVHNQYLEYAMESGIIWLLVFLALMLSIVYVCARHYRAAQRAERSVLLATMLLVVANMIIAFVDVPFDKAESGVFFFLIAGLALGTITRIRQRIQSPVQAVSATGVRDLYPSSQRTFENVLAQSASPVTPSTPPEAKEEMHEEAAPSTRKAGRAIALQIFTWGTTALIMLPATAIMTRYYGPTRYGEYGFTLSFLAVFALLSGTGMDPLFVRQLSRQRRSEWSASLSYAVGTRTVTSITSSAIAVLCAILLPVNPEQRLLLLLGSASVLFSFSVNGLRTVYEYGYWTEQRMAPLSLIDAINRVATAVLITVAVLLHMSLPWAYVLISYSDIPFFIVLAWLAYRRYDVRIRFSWKRMRQNLLDSLPLTGHNALTLFAGQANTLLLLPLAGAFGVGIYSLSTRLINPLLSIALTFLIGMYPLLCTKFEEGRESFSTVYTNSMRLIALAVIPLAIFVSEEARTIMVAFGGRQFAPGDTTLQVLMWSMALTFFVQMALRSCMSANQERTIPYITAVSLTVNIVTSFVLIPRVQAEGAAIAALLSQLTSFIFLSILLGRHTHQVRTMGMLARVVLGNIPALAFLFWFHSLSWLLLVPVFLVLVIVGCVVTRTLSLNDIAMAKEIFLKKAERNTSKRRAVSATPVSPSTPAKSALLSNEQTDDEEYKGKEYKRPNWFDDIATDDEYEEFSEIDDEATITLPKIVL